MRSLLVIAAIVVGGFLVIHLDKAVTAKDPPKHGHSNSTAVSLKTMQTYRTITVSPTAVDCGHYKQGNSPNKSKGALGFPWGTCQVGDRVKGKDPVTVTYNGMQGYVYVHAGWAMPNGNEVGTPGTRAAAPGTGPSRVPARTGCPATTSTRCGTSARKARSPRSSPATTCAT